MWLFSSLMILFTRWKPPTSTLISLNKLQYLSIVWFITSLGIRKFDCCSQRVLSPCWPGRWCISPTFSPFLRSSATTGPNYFWSCLALKFHKIFSLVPISSNIVKLTLGCVFWRTLQISKSSFCQKNQESLS